MMATSNLATWKLFGILNPASISAKCMNPTEKLIGVSLCITTFYISSETIKGVVVFVF